MHKRYLPTPQEGFRNMECKQQTNMKACNCSYEPCSRKGVCCECLAYHRRNHELPACYFPVEAEAGYDRSIASFVRLYTAGKIR